MIIKFNAIVFNISLADQKYLSKYKNIRVKKGHEMGKVIDHATIGDVIYFFKDGDIINLLHKHIVIDRFSYLYIYMGKYRCTFSFEIRFEKRY